MATAESENPALPLIIPGSAEDARRFTYLLRQVIAFSKQALRLQLLAGLSCQARREGVYLERSGVSIREETNFKVQLEMIRNYV